MHKVVLRTAVVLISMLFNSMAAHASVYKGQYFVGKFGINNSGSTGTVDAPRASTLAYGVQGGYLGRGYNWDLSILTVGVGAYLDYNASEKHVNGVEYGSLAYGLDTKLGYPIDDWLIYGKAGYGYSRGTGDLKTVKQKSPNLAVGVEYKFAARWGAIAELKSDKFSNKDKTITINNRIFSFGITYYYDRPAVDKVVIENTVILDTGPEPEMDLDQLAAEPPPDIGASAPAAALAATPDPESWKALQDGQAVAIEDASFVTAAADLMPGSNQLLDDIAEFAVIKKYERVVKLDVNVYQVGEEPEGRKLASKRAEEIKKYLINRGVPVRLIVVADKVPAARVAGSDSGAGEVKQQGIEIVATIVMFPKKAPKPADGKSANPAAEPVSGGKPAGKAAADPDADLDPGLLPP